MQAVCSARSALWEQEAGREWSEGRVAGLHHLNEEKNMRKFPGFQAALVLVATLFASTVLLSAATSIIA